MNPHMSRTAMRSAASESELLRDAPGSITASALRPASVRAAANGSPSAGAPCRGGELALFLWRWLANPRRMGAIAPSAPALARHIARAARNSSRDGGPLIELGPGTGAVTRALLQAGISEDRLILVERDRHLHAWLASRFPGALVLHSDARRLDEVIPAAWTGRVPTVVSSLPLNSLSRSERDEIVHVTFRILSDEGSLIQYSYGILPPLPCQSLGLSGERTAFTVANLPPASVWRFSRAAA